MGQSGNYFSTPNVTARKDKKFKSVCNGRLWSKVSKLKTIFDSFLFRVERKDIRPIGRKRTVPYLDFPISTEF